MTGPDGIRVAVGTPKGPRSGVWLIWTHPNGDIYVSASGLVNDLKISLHKSGSWRHAFSTGHFENPLPSSPPRKRRVLMEWEKPVGGRITRAFTIIIPGDHVTVPIDAGDASLNVHWIPQPEAGREVYVVGVIGPAEFMPRNETEPTLPVCTVISQTVIGCGLSGLSKPADPVRIEVERTIAMNLRQSGVLAGHDLASIHRSLVVARARSPVAAFGGAS